MLGSGNKITPVGAGVVENFLCHHFICEDDDECMFGVGNGGGEVAFPVGSESVLCLVGGSSGCNRRVWRQPDGKSEPAASGRIDKSAHQFRGQQPC